MIEMPPPGDRDAILEFAASLIEEDDILDCLGIAARRKRDREDAELRTRAAKEERRRCAARIRAFKSRRNLDAIHILRTLAGLDKESWAEHSIHLIYAWPLAWRGLVNIECVIVCNSNNIPWFRIVLTEAGHSALREASLEGNDS